MKALILAPFHAASLSKLKGKIGVVYESWMDTRRLVSPEELVDRIESEDLQIVVVEADFVFDEVFEGTKKLRFVGTCRGLPDNVDVEAATEHGILVVNTPARNSIAVAELTLSLMLSLARHIPTAHSLVRSGNWLDPVEPYFSLRGMELTGKTVGIVGLGAIGCEVAKRLRAFDMEILAYDPYVSPERLAALGARRVELSKLMRVSDFITIHCPVTPETTGLLNGLLLSSMKPTAHLVNTAGWEIVEEKPLLEALKQKRIAGAAFDVYETHPLSSNSPLLKLDNVVLTPHIGGATDDTVRRQSEMMTRDIERFISGERPLNLVNPRAWKQDAP